MGHLVDVEVKAEVRLCDFGWHFWCGIAGMALFVVERALANGAPFSGLTFVLMFVGGFLLQVGVRRALHRIYQRHCERGKNC